MGIEQIVAPLTKIEIGGELRHLRYNFNALAEVEERTGKNALNGEIFQKLRASDLTTLLWAGLQHEDPNLTPEEVGSWIDIDNIKEVSKTVAEAYTAGMPESEKKDQEAEGGTENGDVPLVPTLVN